MRVRTAVPLLLLLSGLALDGRQPLNAQTRATAASNAAGSKVADLGWLAGQWLGKVGDAVAEEHWTEPAAGALMGMFRWLEGERVAVYEFLLIEDSPQGPVMRFKHFNPGLRGWEEKDVSVVLQATEVRSDHVVFERTGPAPRLRISYRREGTDRLISVLERWTGEGVKRDEFEYRRLAR